MKLSIGYMKDEGDYYQAETILDELELNDCITLQPIIDWFFHLHEQLPEDYNVDDIVLRIEDQYEN